MTHEKLLAHKNWVLTQLTNNLEIDKRKPSGPYRADSIKTETKTFTILKDSKTLAQDIADLNKAICEYPNASITMLAKTEYQHCSMTFIGTTYSLEYKVLRDEIEDYQVTDKVKAYVRKLLGLSAWNTLECKVMDLFKDGKISWDDVIAAHRKDCSL